MLKVAFALFATAPSPGPSRKGRGAFLEKITKKETYGFISVGGDFSPLP